MGGVGAVVRPPGPGPRGLGRLQGPVRRRVLHQEVPHLGRGGDALAHPVLVVRPGLHLHLVKALPRALPRGPSPASEGPLASHPPRKKKKKTHKNRFPLFFFKKKKKKKKK